MFWFDYPQVHQIKQRIVPMMCLGKNWILLRCQQFVNQTKWRWKPMGRLHQHTQTQWTASTRQLLQLRNLHILHSNLSQSTSLVLPEIFFFVRSTRRTHDLPSDHLLSDHFAVGFASYGVIRQCLPALTSLTSQFRPHSDEIYTFSTLGVISSET